MTTPIYFLLNGQRYRLAISELLHPQLVRIGLPCNNCLLSHISYTFSPFLATFSYLSSLTFGLMGIINLFGLHILLQFIGYHPFRPLKFIIDRLQANNITYKPALKIRSIKFTDSTNDKLGVNTTIRSLQ